MPNGNASVVGEANVGGAWQSMTVEDALLDREKFIFRCPECGGPAKPHKAGKDGQSRAHFEIVSHSVV